MDPYDGTLGYELVIGSDPQASIRNAWDYVNDAYRDQSVTISATATPLVERCGDVEAKLLKESLYKNSVDSERIALATGRSLHRLLLAAAIPMSVPDDGCRVSASLPAYALNLKPNVVPPVPPALTLSVDTYLIFRTSRP